MIMINPEFSKQPEDQDVLNPPDESMDSDQLAEHIQPTQHVKQELDETTKLFIENVEIRMSTMDSLKSLLNSEKLETDPQKSLKLQHENGKVPMLLHQEIQEGAEFLERNKKFSKADWYKEFAIYLEGAYLAIASTLGFRVDHDIKWGDWGQGEINDIKETKRFIESEVIPILEKNKFRSLSRSIIKEFRATLVAIDIKIASYGSEEGKKDQI